MHPLITLDSVKSKGQVPKGRVEVDASGFITVILDSTQINDFLTCPTLWRYSHHEQLIKVDQWPKDALIMGTYGHKLMEVYYQNMAAGKNLSDSMGLALAFDPYKEAALNEEEFALPLETYELVRQRFMEYCFTYSQSDFTIKHPGDVELGFSHLIYEDEKRRYILEGRIDLLCMLQGQNMFGDHKFQGRATNLYKKSIQFRNYALVTEHTLGIINYVRINKSVSKDTFQRDLISFSKQELAAWHEELICHFSSVESFIKEPSRETLPLYMNRASCSGRYGYPCEFISLCEEPLHEIRVAKKDTNFTKKDEWKPWS